MIIKCGIRVVTTLAVMQMSVSFQPQDHRKIRFAFDPCVYTHVSDLPVGDVLVLGQIFGLRRPRAGQYRENGAFGG
jgi:hypothetical protein